MWTLFQLDKSEWRINVSWTIMEE